MYETYAELMTEILHTFLVIVLIELSITCSWNVVPSHELFRKCFTSLQPRGFLRWPNDHSAPGSTVLGSCKIVVNAFYERIFRADNHHMHPF